MSSCSLYIRAIYGPFAAGFFRLLPSTPIDVYTCALSLCAHRETAPPGVNETRPKVCTFNLGFVSGALFDATGWNTYRLCTCAYLTLHGPRAYRRSVMLVSFGWESEMLFSEWQAQRVADGHAHQWTTVLDTTVDRGATYCRVCQIERVA